MVRYGPSFEGSLFELFVFEPPGRQISMCDEPTDVITLDRDQPTSDCGNGGGRVEMVRRSFLKVLRGADAGKVVPLGESRVVAGRSQQVDLVLGTSAASRQHFEVLSSFGSFVIRDLESTNGTKVNDTRIAECRLSDGDIIKVGDTEIIFYEETRLERKESG